ncbi:PREDICTED: defensin-like protein 21 [Theobroma cacao]|uniref:Defensin-like protein 21 n=1 Tax=Theobroma cacao TaxID=3641 RepID=A0AB32VQE2_THECC|nr:PREDICTED: defensin-like protein 21 [Theobroma cacao]
MAQAKVFSFVLLIVLIISIDVMEVASQGKCCKNHPSLGKCVPGKDDNPETNGKCWVFCISDCEKGGFCKPMSGGHHECHCYC